MQLTIKLNGKEIESRTLPIGLIEIEIDNKTIVNINPEHEAIKEAYSKALHQLSQFIPKTTEDFITWFLAYGALTSVSSIRIEGKNPYGKSQSAMEIAKTLEEENPGWYM